MSATWSLAVPLREARDPKRFGRKAVLLATAARARLPIPAGFALPTDLARYLRFYNDDRTNTGRLTQGRAPAEVLGAAKMWPTRPAR